LERSILIQITWQIIQSLILIVLIFSKCVQFFQLIVIINELIQLFVIFCVIKGIWWVKIIGLLLKLFFFLENILQLLICRRVLVVYAFNFSPIFHLSFRLLIKIRYISAFWLCAGCRLWFVSYIIETLGLVGKIDVCSSLIYVGLQFLFK